MNQIPICWIFVKMCKLQDGVNFTNEVISWHFAKIFRDMKRKLLASEIIYPAVYHTSGLGWALKRYCAQKQACSKNQKIADSSDMGSFKQLCLRN